MATTFRTAAYCMTGRQMSVDEALENNLLDRHFASVLGRAERAVHGYKYRPTGEVLSLFQAMKKVSSWRNMECFRANEH